MKSLLLLLLLLLLLHASYVACRCLLPLLHECTRAAYDARARTGSQRQRCLKYGRNLVYAIFGGSLANPNVRRVSGQQNAAIDSNITHLTFYHNMLPKYY